VYNVKHHPDFVGGKMSEDECFRMFLGHFEDDNRKDGKVINFKLKHLKNKRFNLIKIVV
jgi:hypothetical protein